LSQSYQQEKKKNRNTAVENLSQKKKGLQKEGERAGGVKEGNIWVNRKISERNANGGKSTNFLSRKGILVWPTFMCYTIGGKKRKAPRMTPRKQLNKLKRHKRNIISDMLAKKKRRANTFS